MGLEVTRTVGVDLAADPKRTALAVIGWTSARARLEHLKVNCSDERITEWVAVASKIGIDCALGWPDEFVDFVTSHADLDAPHTVDGGAAWRRELAYRATDRHVRAQTGRWPLSVSTDRLGLTAMRCAGLLGRIAAKGALVDRSGASGIVAEVYPGATLRLWNLHAKGYRTDPDARRSLIARMQQELPWFDLEHGAEMMVSSGDAFDAVVAALAARAAQLSLYEAPPPELRERATREGWITLPTSGPSELLKPEQ